MASLIGKCGPGQTKLNVHVGDAQAGTMERIEIFSRDMDGWRRVSHCRSPDQQKTRS